VTTWLNLLKAGDEAAAEPLWRRYFTQLVELARQHLGGHVRRAADEEDVALAAFADFCAGAAAGRFPRQRAPSSGRYCRNLRLLIEDKR
jgi:hypothetical protein